MDKKLPIGIENFNKIRTEGFYYIDKSSLIKDLLCNWGKVNFFTRPRRFGKSLNMSMLKSFFEIGCEKALFDGLEISKEIALCEEYMGRYPVISLSLKGVIGDNFAAARSMLCTVIGNEALRFQFLLQSDKLSDKEKMLYNQLTHIIVNEQEGFQMPDSVLMASLKTLAMLLQKHYDHKVVLLIDEYDVPLAKASEKDYYDQMVTLIRNMFDQALKSNDSLFFAVLTGCLRVAKESIFTGLNNMKVLSITDVRFDEYFGFTDSEVKEMLDYYQLSEYYATVKAWYDGYRFGNVDVYCPWDVISYCDALRANPKAQTEEYWSNTSSNDIVRHFLEKANYVTKREIEQLIDGEEVVKSIRQELTYKDLYHSIDNMWSVLFTTGYLTQCGQPEGRNLRLRIPNTEIRNIFTSQITEWFQDTARQDGAVLLDFCEAFRKGDAKGIEEQLQKYLTKTISIRDTAVRKNYKENFYHGLLLGLLSFKDTWGISSNKETGEGYSDILVEIPEEGIGIIIEVKYAENGDMDAGCKEALSQTQDRRYEEYFYDVGMQTILKYGIACYKKRCKVILDEANEAKF